MTIQVSDFKIRKTVCIVRYELKLLMRSMTSWIMLVALVLWTFYMNKVSVASMEGSVSGIPTEVLVMLVLCIILVTISSFTREEREKTLDLVNHWPISNRQLLAGKLLLNMLVGTVLYVSVLLAGILVSVKMPSDYGLGYGLCLIHVVALLLFPISLAVLFSARLNNRLAILCSLGVWVVIFVAIPEAGGFEKGYEWLDILDPLIRGVDVWLPGTLLPLLLHRLFYLAFSVSILIISCKYYKRTHQYWNKNITMWFLVFLGIASSIAGSYFYVWNSRYSLANGNALALLEFSDRASEARELPENRLAIEEYDLDIEISGRQHEMAGKALIIMRNSLGRTIEHFFMSLRDTFSITNLQVLDYPEACYERIGHFILVSLDSPLLDGETISLVIEYSGKVWDWRNMPYPGDQRLYLANYITQSEVFIKPDYGWYPLPGRHDYSKVLRLGSRGRDTLVVQDNVTKKTIPSINLSISAPRSFRVITGIPANLSEQEHSRALVKYSTSQYVDGLFLLGRGFQTRSVSDIEFYYLNDYLSELSLSFCDYIAERVDVYKSLLPVAQLPINVVVYDGQTRSNTINVLWRTAEKSAWAQQSGDELSKHDRDLLDAQILSLWWNLPIGALAGEAKFLENRFPTGIQRQEAEVKLGLAAYMLACYYGKPEDAASCIHDNVYDRRYFSALLFKRDYARSIAEVMSKLHTEAGIDIAKAVLGQGYRESQSGNLAIHTFAEIVQEGLRNVEPLIRQDIVERVMDLSVRAENEKEFR